MAGLLSPQAQQKVAALHQMSEKVQHVYGLVERFAAVRDQHQAEVLSQPLKRAFGKLKRDLMGQGFDTMAQLAGSMEIAAGRGSAVQTKARILREGVGSLRFQVEHEARQVVAEDERMRHAAEGAEKSGG